MFDLGTNVVIAASSLTKGKAGPRTGSFGFAFENDIELDRILHADSNLWPLPVYDEALSTLLLPKRIMFTNFGNDSKLRIEEKSVICALPVPLHNNNFNKCLDKMLINIKHGNLSDKKWKEAVHRIFKRNSIPVCVVIPNIKPIELVNCDIIIFRAWLKTILKAPQFSDHLFKTLSQFSYMKKETAMINFLIKKRNNLKFSDNETLRRFRKDIIHTVTLLKTINVQHTFNKQRKKINKILMRQKYSKEVYAKIFSNTLFNPMFDKLYSNMTKPDVLAFMNNMMTLKSRLIGLLPMVNKI